MMKAKKYIITITLITVAMVANGQRMFFLEELLPNQSEQVEYLTASYFENNSISFWWHDYEGNTSRKETWDVYIKQAEILYEENIAIEEWMTVPFECEGKEAEITLEPWMELPFDSSLEEEDIELESWMTAPFEIKAG